MGEKGDGRQRRVMVSMVAGATTGAIECFATYPTEYIKTHLQLGGGKYKGMLDCAAQTWRAHGVLGFYRGMSVLLVGSIPKQSIRWGAFELAAGFARGEDGSLSTGKRVLCGAFAGGVEGAVAVTPAESVKTAFILDQRGAQRFHGLTHGVSTIIRNEGVAGVYKGMAPTVAKQALNQSVRFPVQFFALNLLCGGAAERRSSPLYNGAAGVVAGVVSVLVTQPVDLVKTRMQGAHGGSYRNSLHCFASVVSKESAGVLYSGTLPRMVRVGANVGLTFTVFPLVKQLLTT
ncbi:putative tricarboxylate transport protein [Diplonema papillatum]|nr:putative tricarboxylate transport protein [Diplonema papillatum]